MGDKNDVNPTNFDHIPTFPKDADDEVVYAIVESPGSMRHKYAFEPRFGVMLLKMTLAKGLSWPYDYGFVPQTVADDGDPLDILILNDEPTFSSCLLEVRVLGAVRLEKNGVENDRVVACPVRKPGVALTTDAYRDVDDIPKEMLDGIVHFLVDYSAEEGNTIEYKGVCSRKKALKMVAEARQTFLKKRDD